MLRKDSLASMVSSARLPYLLLGAALTALTLIFPGTLGLLEWVTMIPLIIAVYLLCEDSDCSLKKAYGYGFLTVYVFYFIIYHWFTYLYPLDFVGLDQPASIAVIAAGWMGLPLLQALPGGLVFLFYRWLHKRGAFERFPLLRPFVFASLWVVFEWSATLGWTGVPWGRLCIGQSELLPILQSASLFGSYLITWLLVLVNALLAYAILYRRRALVCGAVAASLFAANLLYGGLSLALSPEPSGETVRVAVIQGNISSHDKWSAESEQMIRDVYGSYTRQAAKEGAEIVIWPETTLPFVLNAGSYTKHFISRLAVECNLTLIVGALHEDAEGDVYNALFWITPDGVLQEDVYAKRHLVPFGEYVPMRDLFSALIPPLSDMSALDYDLAPGEDSALFDTPWGRIGSLICFDSIYEELSLDSVRDGAELLILASNDSWFFDSAAVYQHQVQAQLRAIETGRYLVRAGNTGVSSVVSPQGEILEWIDPLVEGYAVSDVQLLSTRTLYTSIGNLFVYLCALLSVTPMLLLAGARFVRFSRRKRGL